MGEQNDGANRAPDGFEAKYMAAGAEVLYRDKMRSPWWMNAAFLLPIVFAWTVYAIGGSKPAPLIVPMVLTPVFLLLWMLFAILRVTVTTTHLIVQYGLFGPTIPIDAIVSCEEVDYDPMKTSYGIHRTSEGWVYNMAGDGAHGVKVVYRDGDKQKTVLIGTQGAAQIASAIASARGRVRVDTMASPATTQADAIGAERSNALDARQSHSG